MFQVEWNTCCFSNFYNQIPSEYRRSSLNNWPFLCRKKMAIEYGDPPLSTSSASRSVFFCIFSSPKSESVNLHSHKGETSTYYWTLTIGTSRAPRSPKDHQTDRVSPKTIFYVYFSREFWIIQNWGCSNHWKNPRILCSCSFFILHSDFVSSTIIPKWRAVKSVRIPFTTHSMS